MTSAKAGGSAPLTTGQLADQAQLLKSRRAQLAAAVDDRLHGHGQDRHDEAALPRRGDDTDDDGAAEAQRHTDVATLNRAADELAAVDAALARLADGSYGECIDCAEPIGAARLSVWPTAQRCADCQTFVEQHGGHAAPR